MSELARGKVAEIETISVYPHSTYDGSKIDIQTKVLKGRGEQLSAIRSS